MVKGFVATGSETEKAVKEVIRCQAKLEQRMHMTRRQISIWQGKLHDAEVILDRLGDNKNATYAGELARLKAPRPPKQRDVPK